MARIEGFIAVKTDWGHLVDSFCLEEWLSRPIKVAPNSADECAVFRHCVAALQRALEMEAAEDAGEPGDPPAGADADRGFNHATNWR